ncbi:hypothetical protein TNCV_185181 [Trichonephila clavipes]|nr:hypothetical protein TNCV_185181 [Trichonephila clavipes]
MTESNNSFHTALSRCHTLSIIFARGDGTVSVHLKTICFQWVTDLKIMQARVKGKFPVYRTMLEHDNQHVVLPYLVVKVCLAGFDDRDNLWKSDIRNVRTCVQITVETNERCACHLSNACPNHRTRGRAL